MENKFKLEPGKIYALRMPYSEAMIHCGKAGTIVNLAIKVHGECSNSRTKKLYTLYSVLFFSENGDSYLSGYTLGEVGLMRCGDVDIYGELPDVQFNNSAAAASVAQFVREIDRILTESGAITICL